ncbi:MAG: aminotransferase class V-fold PLP-dependent enzyme [Bacteroidota bacterium]
MDCQKHLFSLESEVTYLNMAYMSPLLKSVETAGIHGLRAKNRPYDLAPTDFFEPVHQLKKTFAQFIHTTESDRIAIVPSVSYGMAAVARNLPLKAGGEILVVEDQFPSNFYAWQRIAQDTDVRIRIVTPPADVPLSKRGHAWNAAILNRIHSDTLLVALPHVHWSEGILFDLPTIRQKTKEVGAWLAIDATQSLGAYPFSVQDIQPDALVAGAYKWLLGPYSFGMAYYGPALDGGIPVEENWMHRRNSANFRELTNYEDSYKGQANRYCVGETSNFIAVPMMQAALDQLMAWGTESIQAYCANVTKEAFSTLEEKGFGIVPADQRGAHLFGIKLLPGMDQAKLAEACRRERIYVSFRGSYIRVAPHCYNTPEDLQKLASVLIAHR